MKKLLVGLLIIVFAAGMIFTGASCKAESSSETTAEETTEAGGEEITIEIWDWQAGPAFDGAFEKN